jgi:hypothetical protein
MPFVNLPATFTPIQIDVVAPKKGPRKDIKRSTEGALYLKPGLMFLTKDELEFIQRVRPEVHSKFAFVALSSEERAEIQGADVELPKVEPTLPPEPEHVPERGRTRGKEDKRGA